MAKEVKTVEENKDLVSAGLMDMFEAEAGHGVENATQDDMSVPYLRIAQSGSPEVDSTEAAYIEGLKVGDFFLTSDKSIYPAAGIDLVPCFFRSIWIEWTPRQEGSDQSFVAIYDEMPPEAQSNGSGGFVMLNGNTLAKTAEWYCLLIEADGTAQQVVMSLSSTQYKKSRGLMSLIKKIRVQGKAGMYNPPSYYNVIRCSTVAESNSKGKWRGWLFTIKGKIGDLPNAKDIYDYARATYEAVSMGTLKAAPAKADNSSHEESSSSSQGGFTGNQKDLDDDIPF